MFGRIHNQYLENLVKSVLGKELSGRPLEEALELIEQAVKQTLKEKPAL